MSRLLNQIQEYSAFCKRNGPKYFPHPKLWNIISLGGEIVIGLYYIFGIFYNYNLVLLNNDHLRNYIVPNLLVTWTFDKLFVSELWLASILKSLFLQEKEPRVCGLFPHSYWTRPRNRSRPGISCLKVRWLLTETAMEIPGRRWEVLVPDLSLPGSLCITPEILHP